MDSRRARRGSKDADLDLLLTAVYVTADDLLPDRPQNAPEKRHRRKSASAGDTEPKPTATPSHVVSPDVNQTRHTARSNRQPATQ
jgi:hypothetical protein